MYRTLILAAFLALLAAGCRTSASNYGGCCHRAPAPSPCSTCPPGGAVAGVAVPPPPPFR